MPFRYYVLPPPPPAHPVPLNLPRAIPTRPTPSHNEVLMDRRLLTRVLKDLASRVRSMFFGMPIRLTIHGGAVMVLHLNSRRTTRDVDYIERAFLSDCEAAGYDVDDARSKLRACIKATAIKFDLGEDWMNAEADTALPWAYDIHGHPFDQIHTDAYHPKNLAYNTIFSAPGLTLVAVTWAFAVALKLVRYEKDDPSDIAHILRHKAAQRGVWWTRSSLEQWLHSRCGQAMRYTMYRPWETSLMRQRLRHAISLAQSHV